MTWLADGGDQEAMQVGKEYGNIYWNEPDGHQWEILTVSYARAEAPAS